MGPRPQLTLADFKPGIDVALEPEFGPMTSRKAVTALSGIVPDWRIRLAIRNFLHDQADLKKREKERTRRRQRDIDHEKFKEIVDGRTG